jgi:hypothetical protein
VTAAAEPSPAQRWHADVGIDSKYDSSGFLRPQPSYVRQAFADGPFSTPSPAEAWLLTVHLYNLTEIRVYAP